MARQRVVLDHEHPTIEHAIAGRAKPRALDFPESEGGLDRPLSPLEMLQFACALIALEPRELPRPGLWWRKALAHLTSEEHDELAARSHLEFPWEPLWVAHRALFGHLGHRSGVLDSAEKNLAALARRQFQERWGEAASVPTTLAALGAGASRWSPHRYRRGQVYPLRPLVAPPRADAAFKWLRLGSSVRHRTSYRGGLDHAGSIEPRSISGSHIPPQLQPYVLGTNDIDAGCAEYERLMSAIEVALRPDCGNWAFVAHRFGLSFEELDLTFEDVRHHARAGKLVWRRRCA